MAAPSAPINVGAAGGVESATVGWTVPDNGGSPITAFIITPIFGGVPQTAANVPAGGAHTPLDPTPGAQDAYTVTGMSLGRYTFSVVAVNASGLSPATLSNTTDVVAPPTSPIATIAPAPILKLPVELAPGGSFATVQQNSIEEVGQSVEVILGTTIGTRPQVPGFGVGPLLFARLAPTAAQLAAAVQQWEPRAHVAINVQENDDGTVSVNAAVALANGGRA